MASGGNNASANHSGPNSRSANARDWNYSNTTSKDSDQWNYSRYHMPNNLTAQDRDTSRDHYLRSKNKGRCNASKNNDLMYPQERISDKEENYSLDQLNSNSFNTARASRSMAFPRTKFTAGSSSGRIAMNDGQKQNSKFEEENPQKIKGDGDRNGLNLMTGKKRSRSVEGNIHVSNNMQPNTDSCLEIKENLGKMANTNEIFGRLMQIREYIKQVNTMIETLQRTGEPKVAKRIQKLQKVLSDLQNSEQQLTQLLGTVMEISAEHIRKPGESNSDIASDESQDEFEKSQLLQQSVLSNRPRAQLKSEEKNNDKTTELLSKIVEYQERLKVLQNQQATLVELQQKAENRLAESRAFHNQLSLQCEENEGVSPLDVQAIAANRVQEDIDNLQQRINALKYMHEITPMEESSSGAADGELKNGDESESITEMQQQELQHKLRDVQDKKNQLDQLLRELSSLREERSHQLMRNEASSEMRENSPATAKYSLDAANELLESLDTSEKYKQIKEMKSRLRQLQEMVADYQAGAEACLENAMVNGVLSSPPPPTSGALNTEQRKDNILPQKRIKSQKKDNISREHNNEYLTRGFYEHNQYVNERDPPNENAAMSTNKKSLEDDFLLEEKRNKLQNAQAKISTLQKLLAALQDTQVENAININSTEEMLDELQDDSNQMHLFEMPENERHGRIMSDIGTNNQEISGEDRRKNAAKTSDQKGELESLLEEEQKLRRIREEFTKLKHHFPDDKEMSASVSRANDSTHQVEPSVRVKDKVRSRSVTPQKSNKQKSQPKRDALSGCEKNSLQNVLPPTKTSPDDINEEDSDYLFSNQEIWSEMRQRLILREELHQKRRELEELMKKDHGKSNCRNQDNMSDNVSYSNKSEGLGMSFVGTEGTTAATWGGSTQGNPEDDQDDHNDSQEEMEEMEDNEAYSSEGIGPVGDEAPSNCDNNLYPPRSEYRNSVRNMKPPSCKSRTITNNAVPAINKKTKPNFKDMRNIWSKSIPHTSNESWNSHQPQEQPRRNVEENQEERRDSEGANVLNSDRNNSFWNQQASYLQQQLDQVNGIRQAIMRDQQNFSNLLQQSNLNAGSGSSPQDIFRPYFPEIHQQYSTQLQQQQLFINLNQFCHLLYLQTLEIQQLQHQLQQVFRLHTSNYNYSSDEIGHQTQPNAAQTVNKPVAQNTGPSSLPSGFPRVHISAPSFPVCSSSGHSVIRSESFPCSLGNQQETRPETLNNQVVPGIRANNYWDNFRSYSRQNLLSTASVNKSNGSSRNVILGNSDNPASLPLQGNLPPQHESTIGCSLLGAEGIQMTSNYQNIAANDETQAPFLHFGTEYNSPLQVPKLELGNFLNKPKERKPLVNQEQQKLDQKLSPRCLAVGSNVSPNETFKSGENCGMNGPVYLTNTSSSSAGSLGSSAREMTYGTMYHDSRTNNTESEEANDRSLFDSLRESIYTEVGSLISQNESRPHYLMQLFTELQALNSDELRQTALVAIHDLVSQVISHNSSPSIRKSVKTTQTFWSETNKKAVTGPPPNECFMTSDDEEIRSQLFKMNKPIRKPEMGVIKRPHNHMNRQYDRLNENKNFEKPLAVPLSMEQEFPDDNSSDLVLRNKDMNEPKKSLEIKLGKGSPSHHPLATSYQPSVEVNSGCVSDHQSDPSNSDQSGAGLNTNKLDDQIQRIMLEVIPFLKAHLEDACSSKLLSYVCQLTLTVASEMEETMELNQFFRKQLSSLLYETLMKYKGKRLRDCGEDLLVDMSEVLFNELAFLRLVQNMDNNGVSKLKATDDISQNPSYAKHGDASKNRIDAVEHKNQNKDVHALFESQASDLRELEATDADLSLQRADEEDLGQSRDDAMAATCDMFDNEDASRASSTNSIQSAANVPFDTSDENRKVASKRMLPKEENQAIASTSADANDDQFNSGEADREIEAEGLEDNQDLAEADQLQNQPLTSNATGNVENLLDTVSQCSEEFIRAEATEDDQVQRQEANRALSGHEELVEGAVGTEQGLDEIPIKLCSMVDDDLVLRRQEEEMHNSIIQEILRDAVESELDENIIPIREPGCLPPSDQTNED